MANERPKPVVRKAVASVKRLNPSGRTMGEIAKSVNKPVVKIDSGAKPITQPKSMKGSVDSGKYSWSDNAFKSREGTDAYGRPTYNSEAPINPIQVHSGKGVLGGAHMGGHSDVAGGVGAAEFEVGGGHPMQMK